MYQRFWNLSRKPFDESPGQECFFPSECHQGAMLKVRYAVEQQRDAALLTGVSGVGKTMLATRLLSELDERFSPTTHITFTQMSTSDLLGHIGDELTGESLSLLNTPRLVASLRDSLVENATQGRHAVLVVDEAHLLRDIDCWHTLRLLLNFEPGQRKYLTLILIGQPAMLAAIGNVPSLEERIAVKCVLKPFDAEDTASYVRHRLTMAGARDTIFSTSAMQAVHEESCGFPRRIDRVCDLAMLVAFSEDSTTIEEVHVRSVTKEIVSIGNAAA